MAKKPIDSPSAIEPDDGKNTVIKNVKPIKIIQVIQKRIILFKFRCPSLSVNDVSPNIYIFRVTSFCSARKEKYFYRKSLAKK